MRQGAARLKTRVCVNSHRKNKDLNKIEKDKFKLFGFEYQNFTLFSTMLGYS